MIEGKFTEQQVLDLAKIVYEEGDPNFKVIPGNCALIVIDLQDEFVKPHWTPYWVPEATKQIPSVKKLRSDLRALAEMENIKPSQC